MDQQRLPVCAEALRQRQHADAAAEVHPRGRHLADHRLLGAGRGRLCDRGGRIAYMGAIDDTPSTRLADVKTAKNYLVAALDEIAAGKPVTVASTRAYGCSIKYKTS